MSCICVPLSHLQDKVVVDLGGQDGADQVPVSPDALSPMQCLLPQGVDLKTQARRLQGARAEAGVGGLEPRSGFDRDLPLGGAALPICTRPICTRPASRSVEVRQKPPRRVCLSPEAAAASPPSGAAPPASKLVREAWVDA